MSLAREIGEHQVAAGLSIVEQLFHQVVVSIDNLRKMPNPALAVEQAEKVQKRVRHVAGERLGDQRLPARLADGQIAEHCGKGQILLKHFAQAVRSYSKILEHMPRGAGAAAWIVNPRGKAPKDTD